MIASATKVQILALSCEIHTDDIATLSYTLEAALNYNIVYSKSRTKRTTQT